MKPDITKLSNFALTKSCLYCKTWPCSDLCMVRLDLKIRQFCRFLSILPQQLLLGPACSLVSISCDLWRSSFNRCLLSILGVSERILCNLVLSKLLWLSFVVVKCLKRVFCATDQTWLQFSGTLSWINRRQAFKMSLWADILQLYVALRRVISRYVDFFNCLRLVDARQD